ncbi:MAG: amidohydrolase family protein [Candidatus Anammoxibacter sp.]
MSGWNPIMPLPDALDSVQMDDAAFKQAVEMGVLYSCVMPGSGNIIAGHCAVIRNYAKNSTEAFIVHAGVKAAFGYNPTAAQEWKGQRPSTRMGAVSLLRMKLDEIQQKMAKYKKAKGKDKHDITFTSEEAVLQDLLTGRNYLRVHAQKADDIAALLRVVDEFKLSVTVEHAMDVFQPGIFQELKKRQIPVTYGPIDSFACNVELKHANWRNIRYLVESGVQYGLMSDHPAVICRQFFLQTRWFTRVGLSKQDAIELVSRKNAEILGVSKMLGTIEKNRWASFICWNADPFDMTGYPIAVYGEGELLFED